MKAIRIFQTGTTEVLTLIDLQLQPRLPDQVAVKVELAGINFIDIYHRRGQYQLAISPETGTGLGVEGIGTLEDGARVFWLNALGSYAQELHVAERDITLMPLTHLSNGEILPLLCQGLTAHYLARSAYPARSGEWALVTAAAGGVGLLLVQLLKREGVRVLALASTSERAQIAKSHGAEIAGDYDQIHELVEKTSKDGGISVVYDSVGKDHFDHCLESLAPKGTYILYGAASGPVPPLDLMRLNAKSLAIRRPTLATYTSSVAERTDRLSELISLAESGVLIYPETKTYTLDQVASAHQLIESRTYSGKIGLEPWKV